MHKKYPTLVTHWTQIFRLGSNRFDVKLWEVSCLLLVNVWKVFSLNIIIMTERSCEALKKKVLYLYGSLPSSNWIYLHSNSLWKSSQLFPFPNIRFNHFLCGIRAYPGFQPFLGKVRAFLMKTEWLQVELNLLKNEEWLSPGYNFKCQILPWRSLVNPKCIIRTLHSIHLAQLGFIKPTDSRWAGAISQTQLEIKTH